MTGRLRHHMRRPQRQRGGVGGINQSTSYAEKLQARLSTFPLAALISFSFFLHLSSRWGLQTRGAKEMTEPRYNPLFFLFSLFISALLCTDSVRQSAWWPRSTLCPLLHAWRIAGVAEDRVCGRPDGLQARRNGHGLIMYCTGFAKGWNWRVVHGSTNKALCDRVGPMAGGLRGSGAYLLMYSTQVLYSVGCESARRIQPLIRASSPYRAGACLAHGPYCSSLPAWYSDISHHTVCFLSLRQATPPHDGPARDYAVRLTWAQFSPPLTRVPSLSPPLPPTPKRKIGRERVRKKGGGAQPSPKPPTRPRATTLHYLQGTQYEREYTARTTQNLPRPELLRLEVLVQTARLAPVHRRRPPPSSWYRLQQHCASRLGIHCISNSRRRRFINTTRGWLQSCRVVSCRAVSCLSPPTTLTSAALPSLHAARRR